jgi:hypothetical protein
VIPGRIDQDRKVSCPVGGFFFWRFGVQAAGPKSKAEVRRLYSTQRLVGLIQRHAFISSYDLRRFAFLN